MANGYCCSCQRCGPWASCDLYACFSASRVLVDASNISTLLFLLQFSVNFQFLKISNVYKLFLQITINPIYSSETRRSFQKYYMYLYIKYSSCNCKSISKRTRGGRCMDSLQRIELFSPTCNLFTEFQEQHTKD